MMQKKTSDDTYDLAGYVMRLQKDLSDYKHTAVVLQQRLIAAREECEALRAKLNGELEERDERIRVLNDRISFLSTENMTLRAKPVQVSAGSGRAEVQAAWAESIGCRA